jgi:uncharacterized protein YcgL (UPF0745 family)
MNCDVYKTSKPKTIIFVPEGSEIDKVPPNVQREFGPLNFWKTIAPGPGMIAVDHERVEQDIKRQGFSIGAWEIQTTITTEKLTLGQG